MLPKFLRNFTLDGIDISDYFLVGTATIPFMNVERSYYQVGNTDGQHLKDTRLGATTLTFDGTLIRDHNGLSVSDAKDELIGMLNTKQTRKLVFDALPDRYFNVVFEGSADYDATDLDFTPLTLTFTCPEGLAHANSYEVFRNTESTSENKLIDSEFNALKYWNQDASRLTVKNETSNILRLDYTDYTDSSDMDSLWNDFIDDTVYFREGVQYDAVMTIMAQYRLITAPDFRTDVDEPVFTIRVEELLNVDREPLEVHDFPLTPNVSTTFSSFNQVIRITNERTKVIRVQFLMNGNGCMDISKPLVGFGEVTAYVASAPKYVDDIYIQNDGTHECYPLYRLQTNQENGFVGLIADDGGAMQFGNVVDDDETEPIKNETGLYWNYAGTSLPTGAVVNSGHVSTYPYYLGDTANPNLVKGSWNASKHEEVIVANFSNAGETVWHGPTITGNITAPTTGLRTGAFEYVHRLSFGTTLQKRGRYEIVLLDSASDILTGIVLRDSSGTSADKICEFWYRNKCVKSTTLNAKKFSQEYMQIEMKRDTTGKKFTFVIGEIDYLKDRKGVYKKGASVSYTYNVAEPDKAQVMKHSIWVMKSASYVEKITTTKKSTTYTVKTKDAMNIRASASTSSKVTGSLKKGASFTTDTVKTGTTVLKNNKWYYYKGKGYVSGAYCTVTSKTTSTSTTKTYDGFAKMYLNDTRFTWIGAPTKAKIKNPFLANDLIEIDTATKQIFVNGIEREDLAVISNKWASFKLDVGMNMVRVYNSQYLTNGIDVEVLVRKTFV